MTHTKEEWNMRLKQYQQATAGTNEKLKAAAVKLELGTQASIPRLRELEENENRVILATWRQLEFVEYVRRRTKSEPFPRKELVQEAARLIGVSSEATRRYMKKHLVPGGPLKYYYSLGGIGLNPDYQPAEGDDYWRTKEIT